MADETPKIEPIPTVTDAPSIAASDQPLDGETATAKIEAPKTEPEAIEPKAEAESLPPAGQLAPNAIIPFRQPEPKAEPAAAARTPSRAPRFAILAACVALAASLGAIGGSLAVAKFAPMVAPPPAPVIAAVAPAPKDTVAEDIKTLRETVTQLRTATRTLSENLATLRTSVTTLNAAQATQIAKVSETLDRVEKSQADQRKTIAAAVATPAPAPATTAHAAPAHAAPEVTGSISKPQAAQPAAPKDSIVQGWSLRRVFDGAALIEGRDGAVIEVEPGDVAPGLGRIEAIKRQDGRWVVVTARGLVVGR